MNCCLTALSASLVAALPAALLAQDSVVALARGQVLERPIAGNEVHRYRFLLRTGEFVRLEVQQRGVDLVVELFAPDGRRLTETDATADGAELVESDASATGEYQAAIHRFEGTNPSGSYAVRLLEVLSAEERARALAVARAFHDSALAQLRLRAFPLASAAAGTGFRDLRPLSALIGNARVVALGEATHGTREFFQLKHRLLEFLVSEMGFTAFAIEATMPESFDVNEYVLTGRGDPARALAGLYFWTWNTEEVLALIQWMREWNANPRHARKVRFYGFDMQFPARPARIALDYLRGVAPSEARWADSTFAPFADPFLAEAFNAEPFARRRVVAEAARRLVATFDRGRVQWQARSGEAAWRRARQHAALLSQNLEMRAESGSFNVRDRVMAENVQWILEQEGRAGRVVLWAHNGHVARDSAAFLAMGRHLDRALGRDYVVLGFAFNRGGFQAQELPLPSRRGLRTFEVAPAPAGSLDAMLAETGLPLLALNLRTIPDSTAAGRWLATPRLTRGLGSGYLESAADAFFAPMTVSQLYDGLLFVDSTSAARQNPFAAGDAMVVLDAPTNLDFEEVGTDGAPAHWRVPRAQAAFGFTAETTASAVSGSRAALLGRRPGRRYGEYAGSLMQTVDAAPYRGQRVRLRVAARATASSTGAAYIVVRAITRFSFVEPETMRFAAIAPGAWSTMEVLLDVPGNAMRLSYGLRVTGETSAWLDAVSLDIQARP